MNKPAAIYARGSSDRQKESHTIGSQTSALVEYAQPHGYAVPSEWVFQDEGYSGASLVRPGLEALRDLAAQGQIVAVLIYSPDRLSRKYAYQVLLSEEFSRCGVDVIYLKSPSGDSPEDQLVVQFQGMIAEYERAQIAERHRRGKRHRAQQGVVNVLSEVPYGYRYVRKTDTSAAYYEVVESEADVVRMVFAIYTQQRFSINAIARLLNERGISTRTGKTRWERSTVWGLLRNPAYEGKACYGKTEQSERQRITRPLRQRNSSFHPSNCHRDRPRADWIEVAVPALVSEETFALAQEQLTKNKHHSPRRTIEPTLLQGMLVCQQCGYALYRSSTRTSKRKLYYYRCLGSDAYRHFKGALCTNRPVRSDYLDQFVWDQIIGLLDNRMLIQAEVDRRKEAARNTDPRRQHSETLRREQVRLGNNVARLITAYQEGLVSLAQLRQRMPELNKKSQAVESELQSLETAAVDQARYLQLAESLDGFRIKLRERAKTLDICERQQILRLLVKEVLVATDSLTIRHSIPIPQTGPVSDGPQPTGSHPSGASQKPSYLLRSRSSTAALGRSFLHAYSFPILQHAGADPFLDQPHDAPICDPVLDEFHKPFVGNSIEKAANIKIKHPVHFPRQQSCVERAQRLVLAAPGSEPVREAQEIRFVDGVHHLDRRALDDFVFQRRHSERSLPPISLGDIHPTHRLRSVRSSLQPFGKVLEIHFQFLAVVPPRVPIHARSGFLLQTEVSHPQRFQVVDVVQERREPQLLILFCCLTYPLQRTRRVFPARCPGRVLLSQVPFGQPSSLHPLRCRLPGFVRGLLRYCRAVRLPRSVRHRRASLDFPMRPKVTATLGGRSRARCLRTCTGSLTARDSLAPRDIGALDGAFRFLLQRRRPGGSFFCGSISGPHVPLSTLRRRPCERLRMTRGRCGSLAHIRMTFAFTTPRRFNRRTGDIRWPRHWAHQSLMNLNSPVSRRKSHP